MLPITRRTIQVSPQQSKYLSSLLSAFAGSDSILQEKSGAPQPYAIRSTADLTPVELQEATQRLTSMM